MTRIAISTLAAAALLAGCMTSNKASNDPEAGVYDDYYSERPDAEDGSDGDGDLADAGETKEPVGPKPKVRSGTGTSSAKGKKGKNKKLIAKKPAVKGKKKKKKKKQAKEIKPHEPPVLEGVFPTLAVDGGIIEVYGEGFANKPQNNTVTIGKTKQKVLAVDEEGLVVEVKGPAQGKVGVVKGVTDKKKKGKKAPSKKVKTAGKINVIPAGDGFARPYTAAGNGLLATIYDVGQPSTEMPDFNGLTSIGTMLLDNVDVGNGGFSGFKHPGGKLAENFGIHFQGSLNIVEEGEYELCMEAGDGALLFLEDGLILDADGTGDAREVCDSLYIEPGEYSLQMLYYQNDGDLALRLTWSKDGGEKEAIPATAFFPPEDLGSIAVANEQG